MFFGEICDSIRGKIDYRQKIKPKSDRLLEGRVSALEQARSVGRGVRNLGESSSLSDLGLIFCRRQFCRG